MDGTLYKFNNLMYLKIKCILYFYLTRTQSRFRESGYDVRVASMAANFTSAEDRPYSNGREAKIWYLYVGDVKTRLSNYRSALIEIFKSRGVRTVYDVACGVGIDSVMLLEEGFQVNSSDVIPAFLDKTRESRDQNPELTDWQIGYGDWLELDSAEVKHPVGGYDAIPTLYW